MVGLPHFETVSSGSAAWDEERAPRLWRTLVRQVLGTELFTQDVHRKEAPSAELNPRKDFGTVFGDEDGIFKVAGA